MKKLTFKEFKKNETLILAVTDKQKEIRRNWLKKHNYIYLEHSLEEVFTCHNGSILTIEGLDSLEGRGIIDCPIYSVYQLEDWDQPKVKEMTVAEINKALGYKVKVVE